MSLLPTEILNKRYRIVSLLAKGEAGATYRAWDVQDKVNVAIKEYLDPSPETQQRFRAEARRLSSLSHLQLPAVRDHFAIDGVGQYLVSDYVDGVDLQSLLDQYGPLPSDLIVGWLQAVSRPLTYLHHKKQVHLNLKPANIRVTPDGQLFLVDNGLPGLGISPGKRGFAAPEQQEQGVVGPAGDIYALGATLYTLLTSKVPPGALHRQSGLETLVPAREVNPNVEPYLSIAAGRAMSMRPDTRYETVEEFARALERPAGRPILENSPMRRSEPIAANATPNRRQPVVMRRQLQQRTIWGLVGLLTIVILLILWLATLSPTRLSGVSEADATATTQSQLIAALTAIAPTYTPTPGPTIPPTATPAPFITKTGSRMIYVPAGIFRVGDDEGENDAKPSRLIQLEAFYIDETEVTNGAYSQCVTAGGCDRPDSPNATYHPAYYGDPAFVDYPVLFVNWYDADKFCEWREGRLPSEMEWEKAAGFDPAQVIKLRYPWGDQFDGTRLNYCDASCNRSDQDSTTNDGNQDTAPVTSYESGRSPLGLYNMLGNVMEWVGDWYDPRYYAKATEANPLGPADGDFKVLRGGSWLSPLEDLGVSLRAFYDPLVSRANIGFRCAMAVP